MSKHASGETIMTLARSEQMGPQMGPHDLGAPSLGVVRPVQEVESGARCRYASDSAFPCDVAYSASPTASRASARVGYMSIRIARPSRTVQTIAYRWSTSIPLVLPRPEW